MESLKSKFYAQPGHSFFLEEDIPLLEEYLKKQGWLARQDEIAKIEKPGEGNMNLVLRVIPNKAPSFILKQARPWVEKYPQLEAPPQRIQVEHTYYQLVSKHNALASYSPKISGFDPKNYLLVLQDFGVATDFSFVYQRDRHFPKAHLKDAVIYLNHLNSLVVPENYPRNITLRKLNHQHIFHLPFLSDNGFDLDEVQMGLQQLSGACKQDPFLVEKVEALGECYLQSGTVLLHGDFYPGSLLQVGEYLKVIDPEFSFVGPEEWDIAIFMAHLFLAGTPDEVIQFTFNLYQRSKEFDYARFTGFVGVEVLRRLVGLAQLPLQMELGEKRDLILRASNWIKEGKIKILD